MRSRNLTKELHKDKKKSATPPEKTPKKLKTSEADMEIDMTIHMAPKREYPIKIKINRIEEGKPRIDPSQFG